MLEKYDEVILVDDKDFIYYRNKCDYFTEQWIRTWKSRRSISEIDRIKLVLEDKK